MYKYKIFELEKLLDFINTSFNSGYPLGIYFYPKYDSEGELYFKKMLIQVPDENFGPEIQFNWIGGCKLKPVCYKFKSSPEAEIRSIRLESEADIGSEEAKRIYMEKVTKEINNLLEEYKKNYD